MRIFREILTNFVLHYRMPSGVWFCKLHAEAAQKVADGGGQT